MELGKLFFGFLFLCFYQIFITKGITDIEWLNSSEFIEADVKSDKNVTGHCTSDEECNAGTCLIQNGIGVCECEEGVIGDNCSKIEACVQNPDMCGNDPQARCSFDFKFRKVYCKCRSRSKRFDVETKTCVDQKPCTRKQCENEGSCGISRKQYKEDPEKENITYCECPLGTSGDFCEKVEECDKKPNYCGDGKDVKCRMNPRINKIYCQCQDQNQRFDWKQKKCVDREECHDIEDCQPFGRCTDKCQDYEPCISYENIENKKSCHCVEGTSGHKCEVIDECFNKIVDCGHDGSATCSYRHISGVTAYTYCKCNNGSLVYDKLEKTCKICDCGPMGASCNFEKGEKVCQCKDKSYNLGDRCQDCECGDGSTGCGFDGMNKTCVCKDGYVELNGVCERCDCGMNSTECKFDDEGKKLCSCEAGFKEGNYGVCMPMCNDRNKCANGGLCLQDICVCLGGTGGPYCETIYECESKLCGIEQESQFGNDAKHMVRCEYDTKTQKAYCRCLRLDYFDPAEKVCKACRCSDLIGPKKKQGECEVRQGQKVCHCFPNFSYNPVSTLCDMCICGSGNCSFDSYGNKICKCEEGLISYKGTCKECDCGLHGTCRYITSTKGEPMKVCSCDVGYEEYKGTCLKCDCSPNGKCSFSYNGDTQKCICDPGFQEVSGKCKLCDCGPDSRGCSFRKNTSSLLKVCNCLRGFKEEKGYCRDIDECFDTEICSGPGAMCENTIGSFKCRCQPGYVPRSVRAANETSLCQKEEETKSDDKGWKIGYGVLSAFFIAIFIGLVVVIFKIRK